jgi:NADPH:quinone reductase-like Zn-dependent oxidoreductase
MGAEYTINYAQLKKEEFKKKVEEYTQGNYLDVVYELVGGDIFDQVVELLRLNSRSVSGAWATKGDYLSSGLLPEQFPRCQ